MLIKDGEQISVPEKFIKKFTRPMVFRLTKNNTPVDHLTGKAKSPRSFAPVLHFTAFDPEKRRNVEFRYAETATPRMTKSGTEMIYSPGRVQLRNGQLVLDPNKDQHIELAYFMSIHPRNPSSDFFDSSKPAWFELEDKGKEAAERNSKRSARAKAEHLIFEQWTASELREVLMSFDIRGVDNMSKDEQQDTLAGIMDKNPVQFLERAEDEQLVLRAAIARGVELGVIAHEPRNNRWVWSGATERDATEIVKTRAGEDIKTRLITHWNRVPKEENLDYFYEQLKVQEERKKEERVKNKRLGRLAKKDEPGDAVN